MTPGVRLQRSSSAWTICIAIVLGIMPGCRSAPEPAAIEPPRLVLLYATCTLAKDVLAPYNASVGYTKALADFAARGLVFRKHQTEAGQSGIAFASIFTGSQAPHHQVFQHPRKLLDETVEISEAFEEGGYDTFAWLNHGMASAQLNYAQGVPKAQASKDILVAESAQFRKILDRLKRDPTYKAFVMTSFTVTHTPYKGEIVDEFCAAVPAECAAIRDPGDIPWVRGILEKKQDKLAFDFPDAVRDLGLDKKEVERLIALAPILYKADVFLLDRMFGDVVTAIEDAGLLDESLIAFTADHGEAMYRENEKFHWTHGYELVPEDIGAPLVVVGAKSGVPRGDYAGVTRSIDVFPTMAGLAGVDAPEFEGRGADLTSAVRGREPPPSLRAFSHTTMFYAPLRSEKLTLRASLFPAPLPEYMWVSVRDEDLYATRTRSADDQWSTRVFDLSVDPRAEHDLFDAGVARHRELESELERYQRELVEAAYAQATGGVIPRSDVEARLRSLGYTQ